MQHDTTDALLFTKFRSFELKLVKFRYEYLYYGNSETNLIFMLILGGALN